MQINATHVNLYHVCHRELWLHGNGIRMEHTSDTVAEGKLIGETSYPDRATKFTEVEIDGIKIDFYDPREKVIHEVKKSSKMQNAHVAQVKYYIYKLAQKGIEGVSGIIEYPKTKQREEVVLTDMDRAAIPRWEKEIADILDRPMCPGVIRSGICKSCSYFDFCYSSEE